MVELGEGVVGAGVAPKSGLSPGFLGSVESVGSGIVKAECDSSVLKMC